jgi:decaprenylphospho-beta-D-erythro-pentofuranosid-2-ulose 2-reductase
VFAAHGDIDLVISAFGILGNQDDFDADPVAAADAVVVNFAGQVSALTAVAAAMKRQGHGDIVVMSSVAGERVRKDNAVYGATKAGLDGYAQGLGDRLAGTGVRVLVVRPGFVHTKMTDGMEPAPFSTTPDKVAADIVAGLDRGATTVWSPGVLRYLFTVMRHLPRPVWRIVSNR